MAPVLSVLRGGSAIVLVAPHGGRRDVVRRPWGSMPLKMNDLHTGPLTRELAARLDASALINETGDRNDVDLNRISRTHDAAVHFLEALADLAEDLLGRHARLRLLTVHGWNVVQPAVDIGLGARPTAGALRGGAGTAVSEAFAASVLPRLARTLAVRGIRATPGLRYPARARENLLQLFTGRYAQDERTAVRRLARLADRIDAVQLELALPLRLPGPWRDDFLAACTSVLADEPAAGPHDDWPSWAPADRGNTRAALEFVAEGLSGLAAIDERGGRLLLFPDDGRLFTFTGERVGAEGTDRVGGLHVHATGDGRILLTYDGPMLAFPDTRAFVDLEHGLAGARVVRAHVTLALVPAHEGTSGPCPFGAVTGSARIDGLERAVAGHGLHTRRLVEPGAAPRAGLRLADGAALLAAGSDGVLCRAGRHHRLRECRVRDAGSAALVTVATADGVEIQATAPIVHRLPVVPGQPGATPLAFAACRHQGALAGWVELRSA